MAQADFAYECASDAAGLPLAISLYSDRPALRSEMADDARAAGFRIGHCGGLESLFDNQARPLGGIILLDCPSVDAERLAAIARLDMRAARTDARLVVCTSMESLDAVFGVLDQSGARILVNATRGERVIALGDISSTFEGMGVRETRSEDHLMLLRLTEQISEISRRLDDLGELPSGSSPFKFNNPKDDFRSNDNDGESGRLRSIRPSLPDPRMVRRIIHLRQLRSRFFDENLFADPAWDMLLDLTAARVEHKRVSVTSLCIASGVPPTTALRWIGQLTKVGLFERVEDDADKRRVFIQLSDEAADMMARYFSVLGDEGLKLL